MVGPGSSTGLALEILSVGVAATLYQSASSTFANILQGRRRTHGLECYPPSESRHSPHGVGVTPTEGAAKPVDGLSGEVPRGKLVVTRPPPGA